MTMKKEICLLIDIRAVGGIETHVINLAKGLQHYNHHVSIIFYTDYGIHPLEQYLIAEDLKFIKLDGSLSSLFYYLKHHNIWLLHTHGYKAGVLGRLFSFCLGIPVISTFHAGEPGHGKTWFYNKIDLLSSYFSDRIAVSQAVASTLPAPTKILNNFVSTPTRIISDTKIGGAIAFVGRLSYEKSPDIFIQLAAHFPLQQFDIYGDGPMRESLQEQAGSNVHFHGAVDSMDPYWPKIDLLCIPSRFEGLPLAALEAMSQGVIVSASEVGALPKLIQHKENGYLSSRNNLDLMVKNIRQWLLLDNEQRVKMAHLAQQQIRDNYSSEAVIPQVVKCYQLCERKQRPWIAQLFRKVIS